MRNTTCQSLVELYSRMPFVFLTGDLGFMALEPLKNVMGENFINAGLSEQNMVSVAAGIANSKMQCWVYSIAPFIYGRAFEQIRNDVCLHNFNVKLVGNGGGYGYGSMGATHHALEDYGIMLTLQNMNVFVPAFSDDIPPIIQKMASMQQPAYLRLGKCEKPISHKLPPYGAWRKLVDGNGTVLLVVGPLAGGIVEASMEVERSVRPEVWVISELPHSINSAPLEFMQGIERSCGLCIVEEHVLHGSVGQLLIHKLITSGVKISQFNHFYAHGYLSGYYGSQTFHRRECGLDPLTILKHISNERGIVGKNA